MNRLWVTSAFVLLAAGGLRADAAERVVVTASNGPANELLVYDTTGNLVQALATEGAGGVGGNGHGIAVQGRTVAVVNFGSGSVSIFTRGEAGFALAQVVPAASAPVSVAFGKDHLYVLGTTTVESHLIGSDGVAAAADGVASLLRADGSVAQVGVAGDRLVVTEKSNAIETVVLENGVVTGSPVAVPLAPGHGEAPFGFITRGANAYVTIANSDLVALVKNGAVVAEAATGTPGGSGQHAPCWAAIVGPYLFTSNTPSRSISRFLATGTDVILEAPVAAQTAGNPSDIAATVDLVAVVHKNGATARLAQFALDADGNLTEAAVSAIPATANGVGIVER